MTDMYTSINTKIYLCAAQPATWDVAGYDALTYTKIGLIGTIGDLGEKWSEDSFQLLETGGTVKAKTFHDGGSVPLTIGYKDGEAGQELLRTAYDDADGDYSVKIELPTGEKRFFQAKVMEHKLQGMDGKFLKVATSLSVQTDPNGKDFFKASAP